MLTLGIVIGIFFSIALVWYSAQRVVMKEDKSKFGFDETIEQFTSNVESKDWKLLHIHDLQAKMKANGYEVIEARVFDVCKPSYASQILEKDDERIFSSMMPCRVSIYLKSDGHTYISRMNSGWVAMPMKGIVPRVMKQAAGDVEQILKPLIRS